MVADRDGDGLSDSDDKCPDECEVLNGVEDDDGCPEPSPMDDPEVRAILGAIDGLVFEFNRSTIRPQSFSVLDRIVAVLRDHPTIELEVEGHRNPDSFWDHRSADITQRRAEAVFRYFVAQGIEPQRLIAKGYGASRPVVSNDTKQGQAQNRRVELQMRNQPPKVAEGCVAPTEAKKLDR